MGASLTLPSPLSSDWERPGRGMAAPSPSSSVSYSARHPHPISVQTRGSGKLGETRDSGPGGRWGWGLAQPRAGTGMCREGCVCAREVGWAVSLFL